MTFPKAMDFIFKFEGGYVNDPADNGGETKFGISKRAFPMVDIKNLREAQAMAIYRSYYWDPVKAQDLPEPIRLAVFDSAVNHGVPATVRMLQVLVDVKQDGILGPITLNKILEHNREELLSDILEFRLKIYFRHEDFQKFGRGWLRRLLAVAKESGRFL